MRVRSAYAHTPHVKKIKRNLITRMIVDTAVVRCLQRRSSGYLVNDEGLLGKLVSLSVLTEITPLENAIFGEKIAADACNADLCHCASNGSACKRAYA